MSYCPTCPDFIVLETEESRDHRLLQCNLLGDDAVPAGSWDGVEGIERGRGGVDSRLDLGFQDQLKFVWRGAERKNKRSVERKKGKP